MSLILLTAFVGNSALAATAFPHGTITRTSDDVTALFPMPQKIKAYALAGEQFGTGTVGFMIGSIMECFTRSEFPRHDQMILNACVDKLHDVNSWLDLMVFSAGSQGTAMALRKLLATRSFSSLKAFRLQSAAVSLSRGITSPAFLNYGGMVVGSVIQHFYVKYRNLPDVKERKTADTEHGFWVGKLAELKTAERLLGLKLKEPGLPLEQRQLIAANLNQTSELIEVSKAKIEEYREKWKNGLWLGIQRLIPDAKESRELLLSTGQMIVASMLLAGGRKIFDLIASRAISEEQLKLLAKDLKNPEIMKIVTKYRAPIEKLSKIKQREALAMIYRQRYINNTAAEAFRKVPVYLKFEKYAEKSALDHAYLDYYWYRTAVMRPNGMISLVSPASEELSMGRKLFLTSSAVGKKVGSGLVNSAFMALAFLFTSKQIADLHTDYGYNHTLPVVPESWAKYLKFYSLEDRIKDAKNDLLAKIDKSVKYDPAKPSEEEVEKRKAFEKGKAALLADAKSHGAKVSDEDMRQLVFPSEQFDEVKSSLLELDGVFKAYREEVVLRAFNEHFNNYSEKLEKRSDEEYIRIRYAKWFARGHKFDDPDFLFNGTQAEELVLKYKNQIENEEASPLFGEVPGKLWHVDQNETPGSFFEQMNEIKKDLRNDGLDVEKASPQDFERYVQAYQSETLKLTDKLNHDFETQLKEFMEELIPEKRRDLHSSLKPTPLEASYILEYAHLRELIKNMAGKYPSNAMLKEMSSAALQVEKKKDGEEFSDPALNEMAAKIIPVVTLHDNAFIAENFMKSADDRVTLVAGQLFLAWKNLRDAYDRIPLQKEQVISLDLEKFKKCGKFNSENITDNKFVRQNAVEKMRKDNELAAVDACSN